MIRSGLYGMGLCLLLACNKPDRLSKAELRTRLQGFYCDVDHPGYSLEIQDTTYICRRQLGGTLQQRFYVEESCMGVLKLVEASEGWHLLFQADDRPQTAEGNCKYTHRILPALSDAENEWLIPHLMDTTVLLSKSACRITGKKPTPIPNSQPI